MDSKPAIAGNACREISLAPLEPFFGIPESREKEVLPGHAPGQTLGQCVFESRSGGDPQAQPGSQLRRSLFDDSVCRWVHQRRVAARRSNASRSGAASRASATAPRGPRVVMGRSVVFPGIPRKGGDGAASRKEARDEFTSLERRTTGWSVGRIPGEWNGKVTRHVRSLCRCPAKSSSAPSTRDIPPLIGSSAK